MARVERSGADFKGSIQNVSGKRGFKDKLTAPDPAVLEFAPVMNPELELSIPTYRICGEPERVERAAFVLIQY